MQESLSNQGENEFVTFGNTVVKPRALPWEHPKGAQGAAVPWAHGENRVC